MADEISKPLPNIMKPMFGKRGIAKERENVAEKMKNLDPTTVENRLGLLFDDSGSMDSYTMGKSTNTKIEDAKLAVSNFTASCKSLETSIALYTMGLQHYNLVCDYAALNLLVNGLKANHGTPMYTVLRMMLSGQNYTRCIIFSDGGPTDGQRNSSVTDMYKERGLPIDTVYLGPKHDAGFTEMQWIAEQTGGVFVHFEDSSSLSRNLKYLSPALRYLLANPEIKERIQKGETV